MDNSNFSSPYFEIDTVETPSIRAGGPSNSSILNRYFRSLQEDLVRLGGQLATLQLQQQYLTDAVLVQSAAYAIPWALATQTVSAMAASGDILWLDAHTDDFLVESNISHNHKYGQWTLPLRSEVDLLYTSDIYGNPWVSSEATLRYLEANSNADIEDSTMQTALDAEALLTKAGIWLQPADTSYEYKWIQLDAPLQYQSLPATCIEFDLMPCFGTTLLKVSVLSTEWTDLDLNYITGWNGTEVANCGPVRLFFDSVEVRAVRILLKTDATSWGLGNLSLKHLEFMSTGTLSWVLPGNPSARSINLIRLGGKDVEDLNELTKTIETGKFTVDVTSFDTRLSPVITNAIVKFVI